MVFPSSFNNISFIKKIFYSTKRCIFKLNSFLEQIKEKQEDGISCDLKTIKIINFKSKENSNFNEIKPFQLNCYGSEETIDN